MARLVFPLLVLVALLVAAAAQEPRREAPARAFYRAESCWQCHVHAHDDSFPVIRGTRRTGPVIGAPGPARSPEWQRAHFYAPRALVPESQMPSYAKYFTAAANEEPVRAFIDRYDSNDGGADHDGIVTRAEYTRRGGGDWEAALARHDKSGNAVVSLADAMPVADPRLEELIADLVSVEKVAPARPYTAGREPLDKPAAIRRGARLYASHCAGCHGERADGRGVVAPFFGDAPPRNLLRGEYKYRSTQSPQPPLDEDLIRTIRRGAGASMPAWPEFSDAQVRDLVEFVKSNHPAYVPHELFINEVDGKALWAFVQGDTEVDDASGTKLGDGRVVKRAGRWYWVAGLERPITNGMEVETGGKKYVFRIGAAVFDWMEDARPERMRQPEPRVAYTKRSAAIGRKVYVEFGCASCHGADGRGDGPAAAQQRGSLGQILRPADYTRGARHLKGGADAESLVRSFLTGLHGTPMPAYVGNFQAAKSADPKDAPWHLAHFVMSQAGIPFEK